MGGSAAATAYALLAILLSALLLPASTRTEYWRVLTVWAAAAPILFFVHDPGIILVLAFCLLAVLAPVQRSTRIAFFIAAVPFLPGNVRAHIPLVGGANFLIIVNPFKLCVLTVLLPALFFRNGSGSARTIIAIAVFLAFGICTKLLIETSAGLIVERHSGLASVVAVAGAAMVEMFAIALVISALSNPDSRKSSDPRWAFGPICVLAYGVYTYIMVARLVSETAGLRFLAEQLLTFLIPYFVIVKFTRTEDDLRRNLAGFFVASIILGCIAAVAAAKQWNFYNSGQYVDFVDVRSWGLRIVATTNTHSLGFHLCIGLLCLEALKATWQISHWRLALLRVVLLAGIVFTGSRGALLALVAGFLVMALMKMRKPLWRWSSFGILVTAACVASLQLLMTESAHFDPYGTFDYRQQLLTISLKFIEDHPFFGDFRFLESGRFNELVQGQGIVDVTNMYLQMALQYGLIGLSLFLGMFLPTVWALARMLLARPVEDAASEITTLRASLLAAMVAWLVLVATTSDFGLTTHLGMTVLALAHASLSVGQSSVQSRDVPALAKHQQTTNRGWGHRTPLPT